MGCGMLEQLFACTLLPRVHFEEASLLVLDEMLLAAFGCHACVYSPMWKMK